MVGIQDTIRARSSRRTASPVEVVVTGVGIMLAGCDNRERFWQQLRDGDSQLKIGPSPANDQAALPVGRIEHFEARRYLSEIDVRLYANQGRAVQMYLAALLGARDDAALDLNAGDRERIGLFQGSSRDGFAYWHDKYQLVATRPELASESFNRQALLAGMPAIGPGLAAAMLGIQGPTCSFSVSCCSGAIAIGHAFREIASGEIDVAFAGGHDAALCAPLFSMYRSAGLLSAEARDPGRAIRPYTGSAGNAFGEGAVVLALESRRHAERRGAQVLAAISGFSYGNGGMHPTHVDVTGERPARAIRAVLDQGRLSSDDVGLVVGHGNGVAMSDRSELAYMERIFGGRAPAVPLVSTKPLWGHTLGASSAVNVAAAVLMTHHRTATATRKRLDQPAIVCVSLGIGGNNVAILVRRSDEPDAAHSGTEAA